MIIEGTDGSYGFVPKARQIFAAPVGKNIGDYHKNWNGPSYKEYFTTHVLPNIPDRTYIQLDSASYHVWSDQLPKNLPQMKKAELQEWLSENKIGWKDHMLRSELFTIVKAHLHPAIENAIEKSGKNVKIIWQPKYESRLNEIEKLWAVTKNDVARRYDILTKFADQEKRWHAAFKKVEKSRTILPGIFKKVGLIREEAMKQVAIEDSYADVQAEKVDDVKVDEEEGVSCSEDESMYGGDDEFKL